MTKTLFIDCRYGISGDMMLSSLIDLGADLTYIKNKLSTLSEIDEFSMTFESKSDHGIMAKELHLKFPDKGTDTVYHHHDDHDHNKKESHTHEHHHRTASSIIKMINESELNEREKNRSINIFKVIAEAEGKIHGVDPSVVHFHEVGAMDSIIDIVGTCVALESLEIDKIVANSVPTGHGYIKIAHGLYPVPAPATLEILKGVPLSAFSAEGELTTPTGASFLKALVEEYSDAINGKISNIGYGKGKKKFEHPNILRSVIIEKKK